MYGGIAVTGNLLCLSYSDAGGRVFLVDLDEKRPVAFWGYVGMNGGYADAGGVAMAADHTIYVADTRNDMVRCFSVFGKAVGTLGGAHERPPGARSRDRQGVLDRPRAAAYHDGVVWVACGEQRLRCGLQRFRRDGEVMKPLRSFGDATKRFGAPRGLCASDLGVFVADTLHGVIQRFTVAGRFVSEIKTGQSEDEVSRPVAVLALADGGIVVADQGDVSGLKHFDVNGQMVAEPLRRDPRLQDPVDLARDPQGRIYVLDQDGERVQRLHPDLSHDTLILDLAEYLHGS
jgi:sugar lactone lactonase YvrE